VLGGHEQGVGAVLEGTRRHAVLQVGNAVPPLLGELVAGAILEQIDGRA
jgi:site-specific DNA-cytosine methylase